MITYDGAAWFAYGVAWTGRWFCDAEGRRAIFPVWPIKRPLRDGSDGERTDAEVDDDEVAAAAGEEETGGMEDRDGMALISGSGLVLVVWSRMQLRMARVLP